jgi:hypothetical protein
MNKRIIAFNLLIIILVSGSVMALGITPGRTTLDYEPGAESTVNFEVINSEGKDIELVVFVEGELNQSIAVSDVSFSMSASEGSKTLSYTLTMPSGLKPGLNTAEVVVIQLPGKSLTSEAFVGATVGVATQIYVNVPYPGKYAESALNIIGPEADGKITFVMPVLSRGKLDLVRVRGSVDIFTSLNEKIETLNTNEVSILSGERDEIVVEWDTSSVAPGPYRAVATVIYDEDTLTLEKDFNVGKKILEVQQIEVNDFSLGEIAKFELLVENKWSEVISGAYAQMQIFNDDGEVMADFKSATYDISPLEKVLMVAFWDSGGVSTGKYDSSLFLRYGGQSAQQDLQLDVSENEINIIGVGYVISQAKGPKGSGGGSLTVILITAVVVLVLINLLWFLVLRKKLKKK